jgi:hypothetical protein
MKDQSVPTTSEQQAALLAVCSSNGWSPAFLNASLTTPHDLPQLCLKELAACRAAGRGDLAVTLADAAAAAGIHHPRLASHRERAESQQQKGALVRRESNASALTIANQGRKRQHPFWHWLKGYGSKQKIPKSKPAVPGTTQEIKSLIEICQASGWSPTHLTSDTTSPNFNRTLLREIRSCAEAGEHRLVARLVRKATGLGIKDPRLKRARKQAEALLDATLSIQLTTAKQLRENGEPAASLALLDAAINQGGQSPWIQDNRARALIDLKRRPEALKIWKTLQRNKDQSVASTAQKMLETHQEQLLINLDGKIKELADQHHWRLRHINEDSLSSLQAYTYFLLKEVIESRNLQPPHLSLAIIDAAETCGLNDPWLDDNRARALIHLNRIAEAVAIWEQLLSVDNEEIRKTANEMIKLYGPDAKRLQALAKAQELQDSGHLEQAIQTVSEAVIDNPDCPGLQEKLERLLALAKQQTRNGNREDDQELEQHRCRLLAFEEILNTLEQRIRGKQSLD